MKKLYMILSILLELILKQRYMLHCTRPSNEANGDSWKECLGDCNEVRWKVSVVKDHAWDAYIDHSPRQDDNSVESYNACITGCVYQYDIPVEELDVVHQVKLANLECNITIRPTTFQWDGRQYLLQFNPQLFLAMGGNTYADSK